MFTSNYRYIQIHLYNISLIKLLSLKYVNVYKCKVLSRNPVARAYGYYQGLTERKYIKINTVGKCIDVELYRQQIALHYSSFVNTQMIRLLCSLLITRYPTCEYIPMPSTHHPLTHE